MANDEGPLEKHTRGTPMGRIRPALAEEGQRREDYFRADVVLTIVGALPLDLSPFERHIAHLMDGVRPVARLRKKSGVTSADLRIAIGSLCDRKLVRLTGVVVEAAGPLAAEIDAMTAPVAPAPILLDMGPAAELDDPTIPRGANGVDVIPAHVMAEIQSMLDDEDAAGEMTGLDALLDEDTEAITRKKP